MDLAPSRLVTAVKRLTEGCWELVWPRRCPLCGQRGEMEEGDFCDACLRGMARLAGAVCKQCGRALPEGRAPESGECGHCQLGPPAYGPARAWGEYRGNLAEAIRRFKFNGSRPLARGLGRLMAAADELWLGELAADAVAPVPLHPKRLRERGFNQAVDLARPVAGRRRVPILYSALERVRDTLPQSGLTRVQRHDNVKNAFTVPSPRAVAEKTIILVDDVLTTGATATAAVQALTRAGAAQVAVLTLARTSGA